MKKSIFTLLCITIFQGIIFAQQIYNVDVPEVTLIWHRVADYTPVLRSVEAAELSPDGRYAVSGAKFGYGVMLWRTADGALLWEKAHESEVECVVFSPDGKRIATGGEDYFVIIWDTETGEVLKKIEHPHALDGITWSNDGKIIASGSENGDLFFWDATSYELIKKVNVGSTINSINFTKDDKKVAVAGNNQIPDPKTGKTVYHGFIKLLETSTLKTLIDFKGHEASVKSVRISPDEKFIAGGSFDNTARIFSMEDGKLIKTFEQPLKIEAVVFTPDNQYLVTGGHERKIKFYRLRDFEMVKEIETPRTEYIHFSKDGRLMLTSHEDSGLLSLYMMLSNTQHTGVYHQIADKQLNNKDLKKN